MIGGIRRGAAEEEVGAHQRGGELDSLGIKVICRAQCIQGSRYISVRAVQLEYRWAFEILELKVRGFLNGMEGLFFMFWSRASG